MKTIPWRTQLGLVASGYAAVLAIATALIYQRHLQYVQHPEDVVASSGMYAAGDWMLEIFITCLLLIPTFFLMLAIRKSESLYTRYSKVVLGFSLTAPVSAALLSIPAINQSTLLFGNVCLYRLFASPLVVVWMGASRWLARFDRSRRLISYALLIESLTLFGIVALLFLAAKAGRW
jgi:hypothetical protein